VATSSGLKLKNNALGVFDNTVIGIASTAPAYSIAASFGAIIAVVGFMAPSLLLWNFLPMAGIACAFYYLNRFYGPNAGGVYTWVSGALNRYLGYMSGWAIIATDVIFLIAGSVPAGTYTLDLFNPSLANNALAVSLVSAAWFIVVTAIVTRGIEITAKFQWVLLAIEYGALFAFAGIALYHAYALHVPGSRPISWSWFTYHGNFTTYAAGTTIAIFFYWGFDTITNLGEESNNGRSNPGWAGIASTIGLLVVFLVVAVAVEALLPEKTIIANQDDILNYVATQLVPHPWNDIIIVSVLSSTVATLETSLLPTARVTFDMARDNVFPKLFGRIHHSWKTPWLGTLVIAAVCFVGIFGINLSTSIGDFLNNAAMNVGIMVAYYYGIAGIASAWFMKRNLNNWKTMIFGCIVPLLSGIYLFVIGVEVLLQSGFSSSLPALISFVIGIPIMIFYAVRRNDWFRLPTRQLPRGIFLVGEKFSEAVEADSPYGSAVD
jgi:amino acid transporter